MANYHGLGRGDCPAVSYSQLYKNRWDAAFGLFMRRLRKINVFCPRKMMYVIAKSSVSNAVVCSTDAKWFNWKKMLTLFISVPSAFKLSTYHVFWFTSVLKDSVKVQRLSSDQD